MADILAGDGAHDRAMTTTDALLDDETSGGSTKTSTASMPMLDVELDEIEQSVDFAPSLPERAADPNQDDGSRHDVVEIDHIPGADNHPLAVLGRSRIEEEPEPVPVRPTLWLRAVYLLGVIVAAPLQFVATLGAVSDDPDLQRFGGEFGALAALSVLVGVVGWSLLTVDNARRVLNNSRRRATVSPWRALIWWLAFPVVGLALLVGLLALSSEVLEPAVGTESDAEVVRAFVVIGWIAIAIVLWMRPYQYLAHVARRVHSNPTLFLRWLWAPIIGWLFAVFVTTTLLLSGLREDDVSQLVFAAIVFGVTMLPYATWCWSGWTALSAMDDAIFATSAMQRERRARYLELDEVASRTVPRSQAREALGLALDDDR